jgi:hypothetical protein
MAKYVKFSAGPFQAPLPPEDKKEGQLLRYLQGKYGNGEPVDQFDLMNELNDHQKDDSVIVNPKDRIRPISQIFGFEIADWVKAGFAERVTQKALAPTAAPGKMARMEAHIRALESLLEQNSIPVTKFVFDAPKAEEQAQAA